MIGRAKSVLFATGPRIVATAVLAVAVLVGGAFAAGVVGVPSVESVDNEFGEVTENRTAVHTEVTIHNPNPIGAEFADVSAEYAVSLNGIEMARGGDGVAVAPGESTESFATHLHNERIPEWWATHVAGGERTDVVVDATVHSGAVNRGVDVAETRTVETDLLATFDSEETRPVNADRPLVDDPVLSVNATRGDWGDVDRRHTDLDVEFDVYNPKPYPIVLTKLGYDVGMNEVGVGEGATEREYVLEPGEETTVEVTAAIENERLDEWWVSHLENDQVTDLRVEFEAQLEVPGTETTVGVPLDALTYEETIETDIWGNGDSGDDDPAGDEDAGADDSTVRDDDSDGDSTAEDDGSSDDGSSDGDSSDTGDDDEDDGDGGLLGGLLGAGSDETDDANEGDGDGVGGLALVPPASA